MSSTFENGEKEEKVTPEALLERLENAKSMDDLRELFDYVSQLILRAINGSRADADAKIRANLYMGRLRGWVDVFMDAYEAERDYDLDSKLDFYYEMGHILKFLIRAYAYLKKRRSVEDAIGLIYDMHLSAEETIDDNLDHLAEMLDYLRPRPYW